MKIDTIPYYLAFSYTSGLGPMRMKQLLNVYDSVEDAYNASFDDLKMIIGGAVAKEFVSNRDTFDPDKEMKILEEKEIQVITQEDPYYPNELKTISDSPICLYVKGDIVSLDLNNQVAIGIVGTREPTTYGLRAARHFAHSLAEKGFVIVSGMARGIDGTAHKGAMEAEGKTVAVLGCGVDVIYPYENKDIYEAVIGGYGIVISEFPPGHFVEKGLFVARNRLISGLSKSILIVEGKHTSGAVHTANYALHQGKDVCVIPGPIYSEFSAAPNGLLMQGATPVLTPDDLAYDYGFKTNKHLPKRTVARMAPYERAVYEELQKEPKSTDTLCRNTHLPIYQLLSIISSLELKGFVGKNKEGLYELL
ncbi:MAG: DNA-processing protein DprA [Patescibacteria group bacterium]